MCQRCVFVLFFYNLEQVNKIVQSVQLAESTFMSSGWCFFYIKLTSAFTVFYSDCLRQLQGCSKRRYLK